MESETNNVIRVGSRKSELALVQTNFVIQRLKDDHPELEFKTVTMSTLGDRVLDVSLPKIGEKGLFTQDLEDALMNNSVDFVVHSLKDLSTTLPDGLAIGAVFEREDPRDALVLKEQHNGLTLSTLPAGSVIGTSSLRRTAQLQRLYPQLSVDNVRGNLNTRLRKLDALDGEFDALLLAASGLQRMGWADRISKILPCSEMLYAVGQGALAVECRSDNEAVLDMLSPSNHVETYCRILAERSFLKTLGGGCSAPVGVSTKLKHLDSQFKLSITGAVWSLDGATKLEHTLDQTFAQIKNTQKHKLSPTFEKDNKKLKIDSDSNNEVLNPVEVLNKRISDKTENLDCEDTRGAKEILALNTRLYCGLSINKNVPIDVIIKCDNLGRDLANALISKGALEVMKVSQDYIRSNVAKKT